MRPINIGNTLLHQRMIITNLLLIIFFLGGGAFGLDKPKNGLGRLKGWDSFERFFLRVTTNLSLHFLVIFIKLYIMK